MRERNLKRLKHLHNLMVKQFRQLIILLIGIGDHVRCFCCDGTFRNWEPKDDPWVAHARWFSRCNYLISVKGEDYVKEIKARFQQVNFNVTIFFHFIVHILALKFNSAHHKIYRHHRALKASK